jgi:hypothetical protein
MTPEQVVEANQKLAQINELRQTVEHGGLITETRTNWHHASGIYPYRAEMVQASKAAEEAAHAVMRTAAKHQIEKLTKELKTMGVEVNP